MPFVRVRGSWVVKHPVASLYFERDAAAVRCDRFSAMTHPDDKPLRGVGVYWIEEADYDAVRAIFDDRDTLPPAWADWRKMAVEMESGLKAYGHPVLRVRIDPAAFPSWCASHGTTPGRQGRKLFIAEAVAERFGDQN